MAHFVPVLLIVSFLTLVFVELIPGDPALTILGESATPERVAALHEDLGLDRPLYERYFGWVVSALTGDFGVSIHTGQPVLGIILDRLPVTLEIAVLALVLALLISIPVALIAAYRQGGVFDKAVSALTSIGVSSPAFLTALLLVFAFAITFRIFPVTGWSPIGDGLWTNLLYATLPALALAIGEAAIFIRLLRSDLITTLQDDYILLARAKGLPSPYIMFRHALRPSSFSLLTMAGLSLGRILGGAVVVEIIFALPGIGQLVVNSVISKDIAVVQGVVLFTAVVYVVLNLVVDVLYGVVDPRIRNAAGAH